MKTVKASLKTSATRGLVILLLAANLVAYIVTSSFFTSKTLAQNQEENPGIISQIYTGWQMLDMSFSLIDYFNNVGDTKN